ncbi:MAG: hypothetical protein QMD43_03720 [Thermodesulfovibrio sp.]|jgi:hypothetical protein|uniref:hypothetical protein n=1 Tax=Thermodesulfovibrio sp. 1176 TaxID=3043424 RepID=UPI00248283EA|nr:hypothetical protein [Thermodesulfovibrio sp. 1176]MDI1472257.1 hypothetical protein [Thermodesulfovibrio sp. 1176]MDI6714119.1 hypothetical protein [Thermodesulfovibrio sp.]
MKKEKVHFFDRPGSLKKVLRVFFIFLVILFIVDPFIHKHPFFNFDGYPSFYGSFGLVACVFLVLAAKYILRPIVMRREDYYDD